MFHTRLPVCASSQAKPLEVPMSGTHRSPRGSATLLALALALSGAGCDSLSRALGVPVTGELEVRTITQGSNLDPNGYELRVRSAGSNDLVRSMNVNDLVVFSMHVGAKTLSLEGVASNCVGDLGPRVVTVPENGRALTSFQVTCS